MVTLKPRDTCVVRSSDCKPMMSTGAFTTEKKREQHGGGERGRELREPFNFPTATRDFWFGVHLIYRTTAINTQKQEGSQSLVKPPIQADLPKVRGYERMP